MLTLVIAALAASNGYGFYRVRSLDERVETVEANTVDSSNVDSRVSELEARLEDLTSADASGAVGEVDSLVGEVEGRADDLESRMEDAEAKLDQHERNIHYFGCRDFTQQSRSECLDDAESEAP